MTARRITVRRPAVAVAAALSPACLPARPQRLRPRQPRLLTRYNERFEREYFRSGAVTHGSMRREARLVSDCGAMLRRAGDPGRMAPAAKRVRRACERLDRAARLLEQAISVTDAGGAVVAGSDDDRIFDRAHGGAREAAGSAHYGLQRAQEIARDIKSKLPS